MGRGAKKARCEDLTFGQGSLRDRDTQGDGGGRGSRISMVREGNFKEFSLGPSVAAWCMGSPAGERNRQAQMLSTVLGNCLLALQIKKEKRLAQRSKGISTKTPREEKDPRGSIGGSGLKQSRAGVERRSKPRVEKNIWD